MKEAPGSTIALLLFNMCDCFIYMSKIFFFIFVKFVYHSIKLINNSALTMKDGVYCDLCMIILLLMYFIKKFSVCFFVVQSYKHLKYSKIQMLGQFGR